MTAAPVERRYGEKSLGGLPLAERIALVERADRAARAHDPRVEAAYGADFLQRFQCGGTVRQGNLDRIPGSVGRERELLVRIDRCHLCRYYETS